MRIAVIKDNEALAQGIAHRLRDRGHAVDLLHDGEEADAFLRHEGADLIVLDCNFPGCDGLEVLTRLRRRGDGTPVIPLTVRAETSERVAGLDAGADDYLTKPFEMDELEARLRAMARRKNLEFAARDAIGPLVFDRTNRQLLKDEQPLAFPRKELATLECLLERKTAQSSRMSPVFANGWSPSASASKPRAGWAICWRSIAHDLDVAAL